MSCYMLDQASTERGPGGRPDQVEAGGRGGGGFTQGRPKEIEVYWIYLREASGRIAKKTLSVKRWGGGGVG